jgi:hypothetical protein
MNCPAVSSNASRLPARYCLIVTLTALFGLAPWASAQIGSPELFAADGEYLGNVNANQFDPNSIANPFGRYGSPYAADSVNNPFGRYGSQFSSTGAANPYATTNTPIVISPDGTYLGRYSANKFDPESVSNQFGTYGSQFSPTSINNQFGNYGSRFSPSGAMNPFGFGQPMRFPTGVASPMPMGVRSFGWQY